MDKGIGSSEGVGRGGAPRPDGAPAAHLGPPADVSSGVGTPRRTGAFVPAPRRAYAAPGRCDVCSPGSAAEADPATAGEPGTARRATGEVGFVDPALALLAAAAEASERALGEPMWRLVDSGLQEVLGQVGLLRSVLDRLEVAVAGEVLERGSAMAAGFTPVDWIAAAEGRWAPLPDARDVATAVKVATALRAKEPGAEVLADAVRSGRLPVAKAAQIARFTADVRLVADKADLEQTIGILVAAGQDDSVEAGAEAGAGPADGDGSESDGSGGDGAGSDGSGCGALGGEGPAGHLPVWRRGLTTRELAVVLRQSATLIKPIHDLEGREERQRLARGLVKSEGAAGMSLYRVTLDPEGSAMLDAALAALSRPVKDEVTGLDPRSASTRRADALLAMVGRAVAAGASPGVDEHGHPIDAVPGLGEKAQVVVTISYDALVDGVRGAGFTLTGELLSAQIVRRMACDARILPAVLDSQGQVLDLGRSRRLFSQAQRLVVWRRDGCCTYPGCTIPATWCDVHHAQWWSRGGDTDLANAALLCQRHHTVVHERDLEATVDARGVTWHAVPA